MPHLGRFGQRTFCRAIFSCLLLLLAISIASAADEAPGGAAALRPGEPLAIRVEGDRAQYLDALGFDVAFAGHTYAELLASPADLERLSAMGIAWQPLQRDLFPGARIGSREGNLDPQYHTYSEMLAELQQLAADYPSICRIYDIGDCESQQWTWTNYPYAYDVWAVRISDNPDWDEPEPCIVYDGRHHAREPVSTEIVLSVARYLCENYGIDPAVTQIVDRSEVWCVPMMNADGHQWVEEHDPWWRKTLWDYDRDHLVDANEGIDPNRDYDWHWDPGSWSDETYGGPEPWAARETATLRDLFTAQHPAINPSFHSYGEQVLYPFGYGVDPEPAVTEIGGEYANRIGYTLLQSTTANGSSKDWLYGTSGAAAYTVETAASFIPSGATMEAIVAQLLPGNIWLASRLWGPSIQGTIVDSLIGIPLEASIHIPEIQEVYGGGELRDMLTEAATGYFCRMRPAATQTITLQVSADGYEPKSVQVTTGGTQATYIDIELVPLSFEHGVLAGTVTNASYGGAPLPGASIAVLPGGPTFHSGADGGYIGYVDPGAYTVTASHPSFASDSEPAVIELGETTVIDFALTDIAPPEIASTTDLANTSDDQGPYTVTTTIHDWSGLAETSLRYRVDGGAFGELPLVPAGGDRYTVEIPGQAYGSHVEYYVYARDTAGNDAVDPPSAPAVVYEFYVLREVVVFTADMEDGAPGWSHSVVTSGYVDQWHISTERNHTPLGVRSWKCGDPGTGTYANLLDAGLTSPEFIPALDSRLTFWHWIEAEVSSSYPGYAYDGGIVEVSIAGGSFEQITPAGGYPYLCRQGSTPGPFPAGTPLFSGQHDWEEVSFDLSAFADPIRLRFRFGSDGATTREGWHIDDVRVVGLEGPSDAPDAAATAGLRLILAPNPLMAGSAARIRWQGRLGGESQIGLFDAAGRLVWRERIRDDGVGNLTWTPPVALSRRLASGAYVLTLTSPAGEQARTRLIIVR